jgi:hypothetical protein
VSDREQVALLKAALRRHGAHIKDCECSKYTAHRRWNGGTNYHEDRCTCGWREIATSIGADDHQVIT